MTKFHLGDRVRINQKHYYADGKVGIVKDINMDDPHPYLVQFENYQATVGDNDVFTEDQLRPADIVALSDEEDTLAAEKAEKDLSWDAVNHPPHYNRFPVEVIQITEHLDFLLGNVVKYVTRAGYKEGVDELEDLRKAEFYLKRKIANIEKEREDG